MNKKTLVGAIGKRWVILLNEKSLWCAYDKKTQTYIEEFSVNQKEVERIISTDDAELKKFLTAS